MTSNTKRLIELPFGTIINTLALTVGYEFVYVLPDNSIWHTSPVIRYYVGDEGVMVETKNSVYKSFGCTPGQAYGKMTHMMPRDCRLERPQIGQKLNFFTPNGEDWHTSAVVRYYNGPEGYVVETANSVYQFSI